MINEVSQCEINQHLEVAVHRFSLKRDIQKVRSSWRGETGSLKSKRKRTVEEK